MKIGVPAEIKDHETRVGCVPSMVKMLTDHGHEVLVQSGAGAGSSIADSEYREAGAAIAPSAADVWQRADLVVKVKEPQPSEIAFFRPGLMLFTYLHLAPLPDLTGALLKAGVTAIAYETIREADNSLPLLTPMSEVAGRMAVQVGAQYLRTPTEGVAFSSVAFPAWLRRMSWLWAAALSVTTPLKWPAAWELMSR